MKDKGFQRGILFNHFAEFLFFSTELFDSNADMLLKTARFITGDNRLTSDKQIFRNIREGEYDLADLKELFSGTKFDADKYLKEIEKYDAEPEEIGGWYVLLSQVIGFKMRLEELQHFEFEEDLSKEIRYLEFLIEHCLLERSFFADALKLDALDNEWINEKIYLWLGVESINLSSPNHEDKVQYMLSIILYWTALFAVYLELEWKDEKIAALLEKSLPHVNSKGELCRSNEVFLECFLKRWASDNGVTSKFWSQLNIAIAKARVRNNLSISSLEDESCDLNKHNEMIKKKLFRWRKGYKKKNEKHVNLITIDSFKQYLAIIYQDYYQRQFDSSIGCILFLQLWELVQFECQKLNISDEFIVKIFSKYPSYVHLVKQRFSKYELLGVLEP